MVFIMSIFELELKSGMKQQNIHFYEHKRIITPNYSREGYCEYTEEHLQILLRVKLLRSLGVPLEDIRLLKSGVKKMEDILLPHIEKLKCEKHDTNHLQNICHVILEDKTEFFEIYVKKIDELISKAIKETNCTFYSIKSDMLLKVYHPWRRYFARMFDISFYQIAWFLLMSALIGIESMISIASYNIVTIIIILLSILYIEPLILHLFGTTPGKAIFGLRITDCDGQRLSYGKAYRRSKTVISKGLGFYIPFYNLYRMWKSYQCLSGIQTLQWDDGISYSMKDTNWYRVLLYIAANIILYAAFIIPIVKHLTQI